MHHGHGVYILSGTNPELKKNIKLSQAAIDRLNAVKWKAHLHIARRRHCTRLCTGTGCSKSLRARVSAAFYRAKRSVARYCHDKLSVRPSVTLVDCDHTGWNSSKIISRMISLGT